MEWFVGGGWYFVLAFMIMLLSLFMGGYMGHDAFESLLFGVFVGLFWPIIPFAVLLMAIALGIHEAGKSLDKK